MGDVSNITLGPSQLFVAPFATAVPSLSGVAADFGTFDSPGFTQDGIEIDYTATYKDIMVDELLGIVKKKLISHKMEVSAKLAESTLANLNLAIAGSTLTGAQLDIGTVTDAPEFRLGWLGPAPAGGTREMIVYRCVSMSALKMHVQRKDMVIYQVKFEALSDSAQSPITKDLCTYKDFA